LSERLRLLPLERSAIFRRLRIGANNAHEGGSPGSGTRELGLRLANRGRHDVVGDVVDLGLGDHHGYGFGG